MRRVSTVGFAVLSFVIATFDTAAEAGEFLLDSGVVVAPDGTVTSPGGTATS